MKTLERVEWSEEDKYTWKGKEFKEANEEEERGREEKKEKGSLSVEKPEASEISIKGLNVILMWL